MKARIFFLVLYYAIWLAFFQLARLVFMLYHWDQTRLLSFSDAILSFYYGFRMDLSIAGYIFLPVCLFVLLSIWIRWFQKRLIYQLYSFIVAFLMLLILIADLEIYGQWGFRIDDTPFRYLSSPAEAWASISHLPLWLYAIGFIVLCCLVWYALSKFLNRSYVFAAVRKRVLTSVLVLSFIPLMMIPIRGGFQLSPMNQSSVYFSKNNFANMAAINGAWNFMHGISAAASSSKNPYQYFSAAEARRIVDRLYTGRDSNWSVLNTTKPNVIFLIWESFTEKSIHLNVEGLPVTPGFNELRKEGLYFSNVYASGDRTDKGLSAILSGYPALNKTSIIRSPGKLRNLPFLTKSFARLGYQSSFYYGGETEFANIKSYIYQGAFDRITDKHSFSTGQQNSKWGAHDGVVMEKIISDRAAFKPPFFLTWLTLTSHEPYEVPAGDDILPGTEPDARFLNSIRYTDKVVSEFVRFCKQQPWWKETILVIVGDHGHILPSTKDKSKNFRIPMLWLGGALNKTGTIGRPVGQVDLAATIAALAGIDNFSPYSRNIFSDRKPWAFYTFNNGFGFVDPAAVYVFDNTGKKAIQPVNQLLPSSDSAGKALQQIIFQDYLDR